MRGVLSKYKAMLDGYVPWNAEELARQLSAMRRIVIA